jgi:cobalt-precorrin 5A hydrolase
MASRAARHAMDLGEAMIVAGVGCRRGAPAAAIAAAINASLAHAGLSINRLDVIATATAKEREPGLLEAAIEFGVPVVGVGQAELEAAGQRTVTRSERVMALMGVPSVAEAAALAVVGPAGRLIVPRIVLGSATCALAQTGDTQ